MLIIRDRLGTMMGNKLSVISHQGPRYHETSNALALHQSPGMPHVPAAAVSVTQLHRKEDVDKWLGKCSLAEMQRTSLTEAPATL